MSLKLCYQQHPEESAGGAELMLCCAVLCLLLDNVSFPGNRVYDVFVPVCCGRKWRGLLRGLFRVPREHSLGQVSLVGLTCPGLGDFCLPS